MWSIGSFVESCISIKKKMMDAVATHKGVAGNPLMSSVVVRVSAVVSDGGRGFSISIVSRCRPHVRLCNTNECLEIQSMLIRRGAEPAQRVCSSCYVGREPPSSTPPG